MQEKASALHFRPQCLDVTVTVAITFPPGDVLSTEADLHIGRGSCSKSTGPQLGGLLCSHAQDSCLQQVKKRDLRIFSSQILFY